MLVKRFFVVFAFLLILANVNAQESDVSDTSGVNLFIEKVMNVLTMDREKYSVTFFPTITYSDEAGFALGAFAAIILNEDEPVSKSRYYRPTTLVPSVSYSTKSFLEFESDFFRFTKTNWFIGSKINIYKMPLVFFGIGKPSEGFSVYDQNTYSVFGSFLKSLHENYFIGLKYDIGYILNRNFEGNLLNNSITGYNGGFHGGGGLEIRVDTRDDILYPGRGIYFSASVMEYGFDFSFDITEFDLRFFHDVISKKNVLAFQALWTRSGGNAPFYKLPKLGGQNLLRSIDNSNKHIDKQKYLVQGEYRRGFGGRFGAVAFAGFGQSAPELGAFYLDDLVYMYGLGFRFRLLKNDKLNFRFDYGMGNGPAAIFMTIREAF
ncbi:MAG: hypothetical protein GXO89_02415 [Chlorobi bacterium]|nr:hypothetical protein [Chlorobiota bacterium]